jgi:hypothetical protein
LYLISRSAGNRQPDKIREANQMEIKGNSGGAALYAMQQAMRMPRSMVDLLQKSAGTSGAAEAAETSPPPPAATQSADPQAADLARMTGKGGIINIVV